MRAADRKKAGYPQISQKDADFEIQIGETRARPWTWCRAMRRALLRVGSAGLSMRFGSEGLSMRLGSNTTQCDRGRSKCLHDFAQGSTAPGTGPRPCFEGAHCGSKMRNWFSKSAHLGKPRRFLRRCAPFSKMRTKTAHLREEAGSVTGFGRFARTVLHSRTFPDAYGALTNSFKWSEGLAVNRNWIFCRTSKVSDLG